MRLGQKEKETILIMLFAAVMEAVGVFGIVCGLLCIRVEQLGAGPCFGYVTGLTGLIFVALVLLNGSDHKI